MKKTVVARRRNGLRPVVQGRMRLSRTPVSKWDVRAVATAERIRIRVLPERAPWPVYSDAIQMSLPSRAAAP